MWLRQTPNFVLALCSMTVYHPEIGSCVSLMQVSSVATAPRIDGPPRLCVGSLSASDGTFDLWERRLWFALSRADRAVRSSTLYILKTARTVPVRCRQSHLVATPFSALLRHSQPEVHRYLHTRTPSAVCTQSYIRTFSTDPVPVLHTHIQPVFNPYPTNVENRVSS